MCAVIPRILARGPATRPRCIPPVQRLAVGSPVGGAAVLPDTPWPMGVPAPWNPASPERPTLRRLDARQAVRRWTTTRGVCRPGPGIRGFRAPEPSTGDDVALPGPIDQGACLPPGPQPPPRGQPMRPVGCASAFPRRTRTKGRGPLDTGVVDYRWRGMSMR